MTPIPPTPLLLSSNLSFFTFGLRRVTIGSVQLTFVQEQRDLRSPDHFSTQPELI